ncbi:tRNA uridine-5-carboxymethylaminomethyl(34) synthesis GTPase MnmE [Tuberibacillus sp. Marseille-P3662]|uniref:tRNA uridine-5-carboxymethylaminomethyl(34) synthesis GTPase MnmE n=1 Tax=Tuberibacillus sp. Marseille-P3662 TaxID=1965358 RepID=UPI000A1CDBAB|nr:tRNA uridine-5-carboxymethylaminomethyl(34) synthesis GTPase MnmE [Tuberibacillus sp. Marseille-P3662]
MEQDTIAAISTPMGEGAIAIVRISGDEAIHIADKIYRGKQALMHVESHTIHYGKLIDPMRDQVVEEVMVSVMHAPKTFTRETIVEINCHGGVTSVNQVLELVLGNGARLAEPGEFTKRAFLNGRVDLSQAEAVMDMIRAKTDRAMNVAMEQMEGRLSHLIKTLRGQLLETIAQIEVNIDYPEYDAEEMTNQTVLQKVIEVRDSIDRLLVTAKQGRIIREGLATAIIGRPNVGKSSLMNSLVHENKAIVTEIPGTTRDVIEEYVNVRGVPLKLVDTAGIRDTEDIVEKMGVERSRQVLTEADLILLLLNNNEPLTDEDRQLFKAIEGMEAAIIVNKTDLPQKLSVEEVEELANGRPVITTSILNEQGIDELETGISDLFFTEGIEGQDLTYVSNSRHVALLKQAYAAVGEAISSIEAELPVDMAQIDIRRTWEILGEIVGDTVSDSLIDQLFRQFCLGK